MTTFTNISNTTAEKDKPLTQSLVRALRDNPLAIAEGDPTAPKVQPNAIKVLVAQVKNRVTGLSVTEVLVELTSKDFDTDNCFDTTTYRFTPTIQGLYAVAFTGEPNSSTGQTIFAHIRKNGAYYAEGHMTDTGSSVYGEFVSVSALIYMNGTSDYIDVVARSSSATPSFSAGACTFNAVLVSYL